jgi:hypothetical protein
VSDACSLRDQQDIAASAHLADIYFGRGETIILERERIKRKTIEQRRLLHHKAVA